MKMYCVGKTQRKAFTLVELLVVIAIVGILVGLLLPAVQAAREAARRMSCQNNLKQLALAAINHESTFKRFPAAEIKKPNDNGWAWQILPYLEQSNVRQLYVSAAKVDEIANKSYRETPITTFVCPSTPQASVLDRVLEYDKGTGAIKKDYSAARGDYAPVRGVKEDLGHLGFFPVKRKSELYGVIAKPAKDGHDSFKGNSAASVTDGLSNTIMIAECAGRSKFFRRGREVVVLKDGYPAANKAGGWAMKEVPIEIHGSMPDGTVDRNVNITVYNEETGIWETKKAKGGPCAVNCTNEKNIYAFHVGGANTVRADGSVHFISDGISITVLSALSTAAGGEKLAESE